MTERSVVPGPGAFRQVKSSHNGTDPTSYLLYLLRVEPSHLRNTDSNLEGNPRPALTLRKNAHPLLENPRGAS